MWRRLSSGKARHGQIKAAPEKMHRAHFAEKAGAEMRKHVVRREQHAPETVGIVAIVGGVREVPIEWDAISDLARHRRDGNLDVEFGERRAQLAEELRNRLWREHELTEVPVAGSYPQHMVDKVEIELEGAGAVRDRRGRQAARGQVQRHVPGVVEPRRLRQAYLADDLRPQMQRLAGILPSRIGQLRPPIDVPG